MYCPSCGNEERQLSQFCRACGTDLRVVRNSLERPDSITASAVSAREQIGVAVADQIRQLRTGKDLEHVAEEVLPAFEKFLESPEERRLRRLRAGVITASIGFALSLVSIVAAIDRGDLFITLPGLITLMIGLGIVVNGLLFTVPRKDLPGRTADALAQQALDAPLQHASITEHTTHQLKPTKT
ncbi:MAG TPA: zinc ribbon domain-containing protein [Pyrinomonadaceae bacterium]|nr:zinc ribbon domain-containing protein [Pyrinomonadaceae bacterium]